MTQVTNEDRGQVNTSAAQIYEEFFVPALFQEWAVPLLKAAQVQKGDAVLDVACGTGVVARAAAKQNATVIGLDVNEGMLAVAKQVAPEIGWQNGRAEDLPFEDNSFDAVLCQFALMFFEDRQAAIREMLRVLRPNKIAAIAVWGELDNTPGYVQMVKLLSRLFGEEVANGLRAPYNLGDKQLLHRLLEEAEISDYEIETRTGTARFPSIESWVFTDIKGWVLANSIDDEQYQLLLTEAEKELQNFVHEDGSVKFDAPAHIISITKT